MRIIYMDYEGVKSVLYSQTVGLVNALQQRGLPCHLVLYNSVVHCLRQGPIRYSREMLKLGLVVNHRPSVHIRLPLVGEVNFNLALRQALPLVRKEWQRGDLLVLHCRGQLGAYLGLKLKDAFQGERIRVVADFRGLIIEEIELIASSVTRDAHGWLRRTVAALRANFNPVTPRRADLLRRIEATVCQRADLITCVSHAFKNYLVERYSVAENKVEVMPTCTSLPTYKPSEITHLKKAAKKALGLEGKYVVAYCGALFPWAEPEMLMEAFWQCRKARPDAHFLIVTTSPDLAIKFARSAGLAPQDYSIFSVEHRRVPDYLLAADVGLLLRRPSVINRVASPTKFAEYIACGVPVVATSGIGDLDAMIEAHRLGAIVKDLREIPEAVSRISLDYVGALEVLRTYYSWDYNMDRLVRNYASIAGAG